ncbi:MAG TPA: dockerin type I repeat-containing protein [Candidatus Limnocylindria bacterium]|nr:dockerin type I repeat-containing protein [Candidatus Limnocylindria bacterium]
MKLLKIGSLVVATLALVVTFILPFQSKALTYQEIVTGQSATPTPTPAKGKVLGAITPSPDINSDGIVNSVDVAILVGHMGQSYAPADLNKDGLVNSVDYSILSAWYFATK